MIIFTLTKFNNMKINILIIKRYSINFLQPNAVDFIYFKLGIVLDQKL